MSWLDSVFGDTGYEGSGLFSAVGGYTAGSDPHAWPAANSYGSYGYSYMQGGLTAGRAISTLMGGMARSQSYQAAAGFADLSFEAEAKASEERARQIREETLSIAASQRVGMAASGVDISSGSAARIAGNTVNRGEHNLEIEQYNASIRMMKAAYRAAQYRAQGRNAMLGGLVKAVGIGANYGMDLYQRG